MTTPEANQRSPQEAVKPESPKETFKRVWDLTNSIVKEPLTPEQKVQAVRTVLDGVKALHTQGFTEQKTVRDALQSHVFAPDPARKIIAATLVADIEQSNTGKDPRAVQSMLKLASTVGINDPDKFPDLSNRLGAIKVKEKRPARSSKPKPKETAAQAGQKKGEYDFIPHATAQPETVKVADDTKGALAIGFDEILSYLTPQYESNTDVKKLLEQVLDYGQPALVQFIAIAVARGYSDRAIGRLTGLFNRDAERAGELIPILKAFSEADSKNPAVYLLLGDAYLQLGDYREAIASYREKLKIPPKE